MGSPSTERRKDRRKLASQGCCVAATPYKPDAYMTLSDLQKARDALYKASYPVQTFAIQTGWRLDTSIVSTKEEEKENTMDTREARQAEYLDRRLSKVGCKKETDLRKSFFLDDLDDPKTVADAKAMIAAGQIAFYNDGNELKDDFKFPYYTSFKNYICLRDPAKPADRAGYDAAMERKKLTEIATKDQIVVADAATALTALQAFEAKDFATA